MNWGYIYTHIIMATTWEWDYIADNIDLPRFYAMQDYWMDNPPVHLMIKGYLGIKDQPKKDTNGKIDNSDNETNIANLISMSQAPKDELNPGALKIRMI